MPSRLDPNVPQSCVLDLELLYGWVRSFVDIVSGLTPQLLGRRVVRVLRRILVLSVDFSFQNPLPDGVTRWPDC